MSRFLDVLLKDICQRSPNLDPEIFFISYRRVWSDQQLWERIQSLFWEQRLNKENTNFILKKWMSYCSINSNIFGQILASDIWDRPSSDNNAKCLVLQNETPRSCLHAYLSMSMPPCVSLTGKYDPEILAREICLINRDLLGNIRPSEFIDLPWIKKDRFRCPMIMESTDIFNQLGSLVINDILSQKDLSKAGDCIQYYIEVADYLRNFHDYNGLLIIISTLHRYQISKLKKSWKKISSARIKKYEILTNLISQSSNYNTYRQEIKSIPLGKFIPILPLILKDITSSYEIPITLGDESPNLKCMITIGEVIRPLYHLKSYMTTFHKNDDIRKLIFLTPEIMDDTYNNKVEKLLVKKPSKSSLLTIRRHTVGAFGNIKEEAQTAYSEPILTTPRDLTVNGISVASSDSSETDINSRTDRKIDFLMSSYERGRISISERELAKEYFALWSIDPTQWTNEQLLIWTDKQKFPDVVLTLVALSKINGSSSEADIRENMSIHADLFMSSWRKTREQYKEWQENKIPPNITKLSKYDVAVWLEMVGLGIYAKRFIEEEINGASLLELKDSELMNIGVIPVGHRGLIRRIQRFYNGDVIGESRSMSKSGSSIGDSYKLTKNN